jgi:hypothetical protein
MHKPRTAFLLHANASETHLKRQPQQFVRLLPVARYIDRTAACMH